MAVGDEIIATDGEGTEYSARLTKIRDEICECEIIEKRESLSESPVEITLYMAYPKSDKLETVVQKAVELGAYKIIPFESSRCIKRPKAEKQDKQTARLERIAEEAAKQCGRARLPKVSVGISYKEMLSELKEYSLALFCYEGDGTRPIKEHLSSVDAPASVSVVIGAEGGFSLDEVELARDAGMLLCGLGPRILRCETAPSFALSAISYHFEM
jgi:16S rRNA (uracil1498-N3)-methyltransferase